MPHVLIAGMTESGKTTLATDISRRYKSRGYPVLVLDPMLDPRWSADYLTADPHAFLTVASHPDTYRCAVFVDESGEQVGQYNREFFWLATRGRHKGFNSHFITQRPKALSPTVRDQCSWLYLFNVSSDSAMELAREWNRPELREANQLPRGHYFEVPRFGQLRRLSVAWA